MDKEEIRKKLGLKSQAEMEYEAFLRLAEMEKGVDREIAIKQRYRGTGRTTVMLLYALELISQDKPVTIVVHNKAHANELRRKIRHWTEELDLDPKLLTFVTPDNNLIGNRDIVLRDHYVRGIE